MEQYTVTGMSCAACAARVEKAVAAVAGVSSCAVNLLTNILAVEGTATADAVTAAVTGAGYGIALRGGQPKAEAAPTDETAPLKRRLTASVVFLAVLMYLSMGHGMWGWPVPPVLESNPTALALLQLLLSAAVLVVNQRFFISGFRGLLHAAPNMDTLVALGSAAAFGYSTAVVFSMLYSTPAAAAHAYHGLYFESAAMIVTLITVGKLLEARAKGKTTTALRELMQLAPQTATVVRDGAEMTVPIAAVRRGDVFVVRPGEVIPADGVVLDGHSAVNEAALTGESLPVDKGVGASVAAATLNQSGYLRCEATRVGEDTTLSSIIRMVSDAAATKAPIAKLADRVSSVFVPVVLAIAAVTVVAWLLAGATGGEALSHGIAVLVISCPCALGLATPVAIMVGSGVGARHGILFKTATALETAGRVDTVVLDKTGTVTAGEPRVVALYPADGIDGDDLLRTAVSLEHKSEHPLAKAIVKEAAVRGIEPQTVTAFEAVAGLGLTAQQDGAVLRGGNAAFVGVPSAWRERLDAVAESGATPLLFSRDEQFFGGIAVADTVKEDSPAAIRALRDMGLRVVLLTGDNTRTAQAVGAQVGVDEVIAEVLPDGKEEVIRALQQEGRVAMVGDGINDAPALTRADIGMAIGAGTDVAMDAAEVVLVNNRLTDVVAAIRLGRATLRNIRENLFWAFAYNVLGIPLAAGVFVNLLGWSLHPMFGALAMSLSSVCVVSNALRLNLVRLHGKKQPPVTKILVIDGMMCAHCEAHVKQALEAIAGVTATVSQAAGTAVVTLATPVDDAVLKAAVEAEDYTVTHIR